MIAFSSFVTLIFFIKLYIRNFVDKNFYTSFCRNARHKSIKRGIKNLILKRYKINKTLNFIRYNYSIN
nr:MAG TPA: hypothetical protein [Caudoviricetes sp.]